MSQKPKHPTEVYNGLKWWSPLTKLNNSAKRLKRWERWEKEEEEEEAKEPSEETEISEED